MRLIDADVLKEDLTRFYDGEVTARQLIDAQPTVQPDRDVIDDCLCHIYKNELRGIALFGENEPYFCPNCGADMRGGDSDE